MSSAPAVVYLSLTTLTSLSGTRGRLGAALAGEASGSQAAGKDREGLQRAALTQSASQADIRLARAKPIRTDCAT